MSRAARAWIVALAWALIQAVAAPSAGAVPASGACGPEACEQMLALPDDAGSLRYFSSLPPGPGPTQALLVMHGHPRDAHRSLAAGMQAVSRAGRGDDTLVVAPLFQVAPDRAAHCHTPGEPAAQAGEALWTCSGWLEGGRSTGAHAIGSFAALDALLQELVRRWPGLRTITLAGFSAGAQVLQRSVGFSAAFADGRGPRLRYVIASPGSWLYLDALRPQLVRDGRAADWSACWAGHALAPGCTIRWAAPEAASQAACPGLDRWKYGLAAMPAHLQPLAAQVRSRWNAAELHYLAGALDDGPGPGRAAGLLDRSCGAQAQGPFRLQRAWAFADRDRALRAADAPPAGPPLTVVPGCAHDVVCVLGSAEAGALLFPPARP